MGIVDEDEGVLITTTDVHLAHGIGEALQHSYKVPSIRITTRERSCCGCGEAVISHSSQGRGGQGYCRAAIDIVPGSLCSARPE